MMQTLPLKIVGGTDFGRYKKISVEQTYNMFISDGWLVPFPGNKKIDTLGIGKGRFIYASEKVSKMIACVGNEVFLIDESLHKTRIASLDTYSTDVSIAENNANQIAIEDKKNIYIYNYLTGDFSKSNIDFSPAYISFQDGYFIAADANSSEWRLSELNNGLSFLRNSNTVGELQTKPTNVRACIPIPSRGHQLFVFGKNVTEHWTNVGYKLFPYQQTTSFNIDYGCVNQSTIGVSDSFIAWLGFNEKSGLAILGSDGGQSTNLSNDGINYKLSKLVHPEKSFGMIYKHDGHVFYILTFYYENDDLTLVYDFNTKTFFNLSNSNLGCYKARKIVQFDNKFYFVSIEDGCLYELSSEYNTDDGKDINRIRITPSVRNNDQSQFIINNLGFTIEQGITDNTMRVDISVSRNGGESFSNFYSEELNKVGHRKNKFIVWNLGMANDFIAQFRFYGKERFLCSDGFMNVYS